MTAWPFRAREGTVGCGEGRTFLCSGRWAKRVGHAGAKLVTQATEEQFPSKNIKTCTDELNISNKMTLYEVFSTKKQRQAVLCWRFLLHMALRDPAFSAYRAFQTKKNIQGNMRGGGPEESGRTEETRVGRRGPLLTARGHEGQKRGHPSQHSGPDRSEEMAVRRQGAARGRGAKPQRHHPPYCHVHWVEVTCSCPPGSPSFTCVVLQTPLTSAGALP